VLLNMNRKYLLRAVKLGFDQVYVTSPKSPVLCQDGDRQYVWALLNPESALGPIEDAVCVESPPAGEPSRTRQSKPRKRKATMPDPKPPRSGRGKTNGQPRAATDDKADPQDVAELIQQAEAVNSLSRSFLQRLKLSRFSRLPWVDDLAAEDGGPLQGVRQDRRPVLVVVEPQGSSSAVPACPPRSTVSGRFARGVRQRARSPRLLPVVLLDLTSC
jgi:hypothetical protein